MTGNWASNAWMLYAAAAVSAFIVSVLTFPMALSLYGWYFHFLISPIPPDVKDLAETVMMQDLTGAVMGFLLTIYGVVLGILFSVVAYQSRTAGSSHNRTGETKP